MSATSRITASFIVFTVLSLILTTGCGQQASYGTIGETPIPKLYTVSDHSEALAILARDRVKGATILHLDAHIDFRHVSDNRMAALKKINDSGKFNNFDKVRDAGSKSPFEIGNWLYPAWKLGIADRIIWVSSNIFDDTAGLRSSLKNNRFPETEIDNFEVVDGIGRGKLFGHDFTIINIDKLGSVMSAIDDPVVLSADMDFLSIKGSDQSAVDVFESMISELFGIKVSEAIIAESVNDGFTPVSNLFLSQLLADCLRDPSPLKDGELDAKWYSLSSGEKLFNANDFKGSISAYNEALEEDAAMAPAYYGKAQVYFAMGNKREMELNLEKAIKIDDDYWYGWLDMAKAVRDQKRIPERISYIKRALGHRKSVYAYLAYANSLYDLKRRPEAIKAYEDINKRFGVSSQIYLYIGETQFEMKDYDAALRSFAKGLRLIDPDSMDDIYNYPVTIRNLVEVKTKFGPERLRAVDPILLEIVTKNS